MDKKTGCASEKRQPVFFAGKICELLYAALILIST